MASTKQLPGLILRIKKLPERFKELRPANTVYNTQPLNLSDRIPVDPQRPRHSPQSQMKTTPKRDLTLTACILYLAIPNLIFGLYLSNVSLSLFTVAAVAVAMTSKYQTSEKDYPNRSLIFYGLITAIALLWTYLSGITGDLYATTDWPIRLTLLNDLIHLDWPIIYRGDDGSNAYLRAPLGYYLPSALIGKLFNSYPIGNACLYLWTSLGVMLSLTIITQNLKTKDLLIAIPVLILFSGMDSLGHLVSHHFHDTHLLGTEHLEWWVGKYQYSSNTTLLFWVPNHAVSAWIFASLVYRYRDCQGFLSLSPLLLSLLLVFSPLSFIGCAIMFVYLLYRNRRFLKTPGALMMGSFIALPVFAFNATYITSALNNVPKPDLNIPFVFVKESLRYFGFIGLEFFALSIALFPKARDKSLLIFITLVLASMPLFPRFGPGNDLVMRASIAPLFLLCLLSIDTLSDLIRRKEWRWAFAIMTLLMIGSINPIHELARGFTNVRTDFQPSQNLYEFSEHNAGHYYAPCNHSSFIVCDPIREKIF